MVWNVTAAIIKKTEYKICRLNMWMRKECLSGGNILYSIFLMKDGRPVPLTPPIIVTHLSPPVTSCQHEKEYTLWLTLTLHVG